MLLSGKPSNPKNLTPPVTAKAPPPVTGQVAKHPLEFAMKGLGIIAKAGTGKGLRLAALVGLGVVVYLAVCATPLGAAQVRVRDGQEVRLLLHNTVTTENVEREDTIDFDVAEDVVVNGHVVIAKGAPATGTVVRIKGAGKRNAKEASVTFRFIWVRSVDNQQLPLRALPYKGKKKGDTKENEVVANEPILWGGNSFIGAAKGKTYAAFLDCSAVINAPEAVPVRSSPLANAAALNPGLTVPTGDITIVTTPPGVELFIDGRSYGPTPVRATLVSGEHTYVVGRPGREFYRKTFLIQSGSVVTLKVDLSGAAVSAAPVGPVTGYVTSVERNQVMVDLGTAQGLKKGTRLALYKASDPNTRVGVFEVTQVLDSGSRARIVMINPGVKPEFGDYVYLESGVVTVRTVPPGASVVADGSPVGSPTPTSFSLTTGHHVLVLTLAGSRPVQVEVDVKPEGITVEKTLR